MPDYPDNLYKSELANTKETKKVNLFYSKLVTTSFFVFLVPCDCYIFCLILRIPWVTMRVIRSKEVVPFVVDSLLIVTPIVGFRNCSMFCTALLYVHSSFAIILRG